MIARVGQPESASPHAPASEERSSLASVTIMARVVLLEVSRVAGLDRWTLAHRRGSVRGSGKRGVAPGGGIGDCDFHYVKATPEE